MESHLLIPVLKKTGTLSTGYLLHVLGTIILRYSREVGNLDFHAEVPTIKCLKIYETMWTTSIQVQQIHLRAIRLTVPTSLNSSKTLRLNCLKGQGEKYFC